LLVSFGILDACSGLETNGLTSRYSQRRQAAVADLKRSAKPMSPLENFYRICLLASPLLLAANGVWAYRDARRRGRSGLLVCFLVVGTFPIGVVFWLVARPGLLEDAPVIAGPERKPAESGIDPDAALKERANAGLL
jgi:hypothetical protein